MAGVPPTPPLGPLAQNLYSMCNAERRESGEWGGLAKDTLAAGSSSSVGRGRGGESGGERKRIRGECENGARVIEIVLFEKVRFETRYGREGENERESERESERVGEEKKPRMIETSKELQENERKKAVVFAEGRVVVSPTLSAPRPYDSLHSGSFRI